MEEMILKALAFSAEKHRDTYRKGNKAPYIVHPLEVMTILMTEKYPTPVLVAGLLHDTLEDTDTTKEELREHFGEEVLHLVMYNSEDKSRSWIERKHHTIEQMNNEWDDLASALCFADKLANLRSLFRAIEAHGLGIFEEMNAPKEHVVAYYYNILLAGWHLIGLEMYHEYEVLLNLVHQAVQDDRNEIDRAIIDAYGEQVSGWINQKPTDYKRLFLPRSTWPTAIKNTRWSAWRERYCLRAKVQFEMSLWRSIIMNWQPSMEIWTRLSTSEISTRLEPT